MEYPTGIGTSDATSIHLLGHDLARELIGTIGFGELALWLATQQRPTPQQVRVFEAVLVALADHGFTPTAIAARLTLYSAPDALQGAIAAGLLGGGSRFLGVTEQEGLRGPHLRLFEAIGRVHAEVLGRRLPLNGAGVSGAALADLGLPPELLRGVALLARAAGLLGHLAEELRHPIAPDIYASIDRNAVYRPAASNDIPEQR